MEFIHNDTLSCEIMYIFEHDVNFCVTEKCKIQRETINQIKESD